MHTRLGGLFGKTPLYVALSNHADQHKVSKNSLVKEKIKEANAPLIVGDGELPFVYKDQKPLKKKLSKKISKEE